MCFFEENKNKIEKDHTLMEEQRARKNSESYNGVEQ
jgi:hypothetical protein